MYSTRSGKMLGLLYLAPALLFVAIFTAYPLGQMIWMSFHNWTIIEPARWVGPANFVKAWNDNQFWVSLGFTLKYTLYLTPILMIGGYLIALLVATNTRTRKVTRGIVFVPVVIGLSVSSLLWYWLFSYHYGLINQGLSDLGLIDKPIVWFGESAERALWAVIVSIVWKVIGFGMLLFVAAIQAIPPDINEAAMADGASYWQRVRRITVPLTARTVLLVTLFSIIGSLLAVMMEQAQRVIARERLIELAGTRSSDSSDRSIDVLVSRLRRKLSVDGRPAPIVTVRGVGYMFAAAVTYD